MILRFMKYIIEQEILGKLNEMLYWRVDVLWTPHLAILSSLERHVVLWEAERRGRGIMRFKKH